MGIVLLRYKIMPTSPDVNLEDIKKETGKIIEENHGKNPNFEEEPIAFGLNAVIASFSIDEKDSLNPIEEGLRKIKNVNSAEVIDMRRAFG